MVAAGDLADGLATEDGVGLHHVGEQLHEAVVVRPGARAWRVRRDPGSPAGWTEEPVAARLLEGIDG